MIKAIAKLILEKMSGKKKYQTFFKKLYKVSMSGMNIGSGARTESSGEQNSLMYINQQLNQAKNIVIFDVGANVGHYSILLKSVFGDKVQIFSFEPSRKTYNTLLLNTRNLTNIKQYNFGFGKEDSKLILFTNNDESGLASLYHRKLDHYGIQMDKTEEIEIETIDGFCTRNEIQHIHLLKIDVEGHELKVLNGASKILNTGNVDYIQFEFGGCNIDSRTYFQDFFYLLKDKYRIFRILKDGIYKIEHYDETCETFLTTNFLAERIAK